MTNKQLREELEKIKTEGDGLEIGVGNSNDFRTETGEAWSDITELNGDEIVEEI